MKLAESGLPKGGGVGYEIFDKSDALGATSFVQNINHLRALEGELARTIRAIERVQPRASIWCSRNGRCSRAKRPSLGLDRAQGARHARAATGARHPPSRRQRRQRAQAGASLGRRREPAGSLPTAAPTIPAGGVTRTSESSPTRNRMREQVESIVTSVVGPGHARVQITADFDFNRITQTSDNSIPRAASCDRARPAKNTASSDDPTAGLGRQRAARQQRSEGAAAARPEPQDRRSRQLRDLPHHKDRSDRGGPRNRVSAAVVVDGIYAKNDKGDSPISRAPRKKSTVSPHPCARAIGFDPKRGDQIEVVNLRLIDIYVNNRLVARGEVVLVEGKLGVTMTEIIKADHN